MSVQHDSSLRERVVGHVAQLSLASLIGGAGLFLSNYSAALLLGPAVWGTWQGVSLVLQYGANLHLGVQNGMQRELPILRGRKEVERQAIVTDVTFTFSFIVGCVVSLLVLGASFLPALDPNVRICLRVIPAALFLTYITGFYGSLFRARSEFGLVSRITIFNGVANVLSVGLVFLLGLPGFLLGQVFGLLVVALYSWRRSSHAVRWRWDSAALRSLIFVGFPIMLLVFSNVIFHTVDRLLTLGFLGTESLGFYSLGNIAFAPLLMILTAGTSVMYPRFTERYGETGDPSSLKAYIIVPMENLALLVPILIGGLYLALPLLVRVFLPQYVQGIGAARILLVGLFFYAISGMAGNMFLTINRQVLRLGILLGTALVNLGLGYGALKLGYGIVGVAVASSVGYLVYFSVSCIAALRYALASTREIALLLWKVLAPVLGIAVIVIVLSHFLHLSADEGEGLLLRTVFGELIFAALFCYPAYRAVRRVVRWGLTGRRSGG